jgi:hypothetical protein
MRIRIRDPEILLTLDLGSEMEKIRIRDKHPGSATLVPVPSFYRMWSNSTSKIVRN